MPYKSKGLRGIVVPSTKGKRSDLCRFNTEPIPTENSRHNTNNQEPKQILKDTKIDNTEEENLPPADRIAKKLRSFDINTIFTTDPKWTNHTQRQDNLGRNEESKKSPAKCILPVT